MQTRRNLFFTALAGLFLGLLATGPAGAQGFSIPAAGLGDKPAFWRTVMTHFYGLYDRARKCWKADADGTIFCMRPHRLDEATDGGAHRVFLVTSGAGKDGGDCHACTGAMGLIVLEQRGDELVFVAHNGLAEETGSWGSIPPEEAFGIRKIGPSGSGWTMESGWTGQGYTLGSQFVYGLIGDRVTEIGQIPTVGDDCGADPDKCHSYSFDIGFVETAGPFYDVELTLAAGSDKPEGADRYRIPFNAGTMKYDVPEALNALLFR